MTGQNVALGFALFTGSWFGATALIRWEALISWMSTPYMLWLYVFAAIIIPRRVFTRR